MEEYVSIDKLKAALRTLKSLGHKYYQFVKDLDLDDYEDRCKETDIEGFNFLSGRLDDNIDDIATVDKEHKEHSEDNEDRDEDEDKEHEVLTKDSVSKFQFDYNRNTCFNNDVPELVVPESENENISIAPGEGKIPTSILLDDDWDMKSHPT